MSTDAGPDATVLVCTKDRGDEVVASLHSILADQSVVFELLVLDQSTADDTAAAVAEIDDPRLRYHRLSSSGLSNARNEGLRLARADVVVMTDDDCRVAPDWVGAMVAVMAEEPLASCAFCTVLAAPHDSEVGFIPHAIQSDEAIVDDPHRFDAGRGIGAGMAVRRDDVVAVGGFDPMLGAGAPFRSAEEGDLALRLCQGGHRIRYTARTSVVHDGFRTHVEGRTLTRGYMYGTAASLGKHLRCRRWSALRPLRVMVVDCVLRPTWDALRARKVPRVAGRATYMVRGLVEGAAHPADRERCVMIPRASAPTSQMAVEP